MFVQFTASFDSWIWKPLEYAFSQVSTIWQSGRAPPRSTCSHCGSPTRLDQRVTRLSSTAYVAAYIGLPSWSDDAVAGRPIATFVGPQFPLVGLVVGVGVGVGLVVPPVPVKTENSQ